MTKERELLQKVLTKLNSYYYEGNVTIKNEIIELLAQPEQEPVAWKVIDKTNGNYMFSRIKPTERSYKYDVVIPLYTPPPKRTSLSEEAVGELLMGGFSTHMMDLVRMIEKAHGIGGGE